MSDFRILVVSDIHAGRKNRATDLTPNPDQYASQNYIQKFLESLQTKGLNPDVLLIPGDLTETCQPEEVSLASQLIAAVQDAFGLPKERIFAVPGNHDVNWDLADAFSSSDDTAQHKKFDPIKENTKLVNSAFSYDYGDLFRPPFAALSYDDFRLVAAINTAWKDGPNVKPHYGDIHPEALKWLESNLPSVGNGHRVRLCMAHHHPIAYRDPLPHLPDFSQMNGAAYLLNFLKRHDFDIFVHGHKHMANIQSHQIQGVPVVIVASGSFSARLEATYTGYATNNFHWIEVSGRTQGSGRIYGRVRNYHYVEPGSWKACSDSLGLRHMIPFGWPADPKALHQHVGEFVKATVQSQGYCRWNWVHSVYPETEHVDPDVAKDVFDVIAEELGCSVLGSEVTELTLLKD